MKIIEFGTKVYAPGLHLAYSAMWFLSLLGVLVLVAGDAQSWVFNIEVGAGILTLFLVLFYLRVADEIKDLEYDRTHNPDRPLVTGMVTKRDLYVYMGIVAVVTVLLNVWMSRLLTLIVLLDLVWGGALIGIEKLSKAVKDNMICNLLFTYPVNIALGVYTYVFFLQEYGKTFGTEGILLVVAFSLAFLNYEFARKIAWPHLSSARDRLYSNALGGLGSAAMTVMFGLVALVIVVTLVEPWSVPGMKKYAWLILIVPTVIAILGFVQFVSEKKKKRKYTVYGTVFLTLFYLSLGILSLSANEITIK